MGRDRHDHRVEDQISANTANCRRRYPRCLRNFLIEKQDLDMARYVLTMQSHVAYGFVGNTAAVFRYSSWDFTPIVVNTVQFSNHTGHPTFRGAVFSKRTSA